MLATRTLCPDGGVAGFLAQYQMAGGVHDGLDRVDGSVVGGLYFSVFWGGLSVIDRCVVCVISMAGGGMVGGTLNCHPLPPLLAGQSISLGYYVNQTADPVSVDYVATCQLPTRWGVFDMHGFEQPGGREHVVLTLGDVQDGAPLARIHSECLTGDALFSLRCDCGFQLEAALEAIATEGRGVLVYLRQEGRGIGLINKIRAYKLQDGGADTVEANEQLGFPADMRDFRIAREMLVHLGVASVRLMTNNPRKIATLQQAGINIAERVPLKVGRNRYNDHYLDTKQAKLGHMLETPDQ